MRVQKETDFNEHGKYFLCEDFKRKTALRMEILRKKIRAVKILRYSSVSIFRAALYKIHANQTSSFVPFHSWLFSWRTRRIQLYSETI